VENVNMTNLEQLCVPVLKDATPTHPNPPSELMPFLQYVDLACYHITSTSPDGAPITLPANLQAELLRHLNPVLAVPAILPASQLAQRVTLGAANQLCVPVAKSLPGGGSADPPAQVQHLIENIDLECFALQEPRTVINLPILLHHLNPLLASF